MFPRARPHPPTPHQPTHSFIGARNQNRTPPTQLPTQTLRTHPPTPDSTGAPHHTTGALTNTLQPHKPTKTHPNPDPTSPVKRCIRTHPSHPPLFTRLFTPPPTSTTLQPHPHRPTTIPLHTPPPHGPVSGDRKTVAERTTRQTGGGGNVYIFRGAPVLQGPSTEAGTLPEALRSVPW